MRKVGRTRRIARFALLAALSLSLSALENIFAPILPPGAKAGLSNIVVMFAATSYGLPAALLLAGLKAVYALLVRGVMAFLMSFFGGVFSAVTLWLLFRFARRRVGLLGISMAGALVHNAAQGCVALAVFGSSLLGYIPILLLLSLPSGMITGALFGSILKLQEYRQAVKKEI